MHIKHGVFFASLLVLVSASGVSAQVDTTVTTETSVVTASPSARSKQLMKREVVQNKLQDLRAEVEEKRTEAKEAAEARKEALRAKIAGIRDLQKKAIVQRMDGRFESINDSSTERWTEALEKMSSLVDRVSSEAADMNAAGMDTTTLDTSITQARTAIQTAQNAVTTQAGKTYIMPITTDAAIKTNVGTTVTQFRLDLKNTHQTVLAAKLAVRNTLKSLVELKSTPIRNTPVASGSAGTEE